MRIAYLCADFGIPIHGSKGASIHVRELSRALAAQGHEVLILAPRRGGAAPDGYHVPVIELAPERYEEALR
ncbi:MAG: glycosyltransferase, partial [Candidatus Limnocylindria bacterium]